MPLCRILNRQGVEIRRFSTDSLPVGSLITVGRSQSCTIPLQHESTHAVSREHFALEHRHLGWVLVNKSSHGTIRGDQTIDHADVKSGDVFQFGGCFLCVGAEALPSGYRLHWQDDEAAKEDFALLWEGHNTIGQLPTNTILLPDKSVSRQHARITVHGSDLVLEDLNSFVGTFAGDKRISAPTHLAPNARLRFGAVHAWVKPVEGVAPGRGMARPHAPGRPQPWLTAAVWIAILVVVAVILLIALA